MLYRRKGSSRWWVRYTAPDGREVRESTGTENRKLAEEYAARSRHQAYRVSKLGDQPRRSWEDAVIRWLDETTKKTRRDDVSIFRRLDLHLRGKELGLIGQDDVRAIVRQMRTEGLTPGRINRVLCLVRAVLRKAERNWGWIERAPAVEMLPLRNRRLRWLTRNEADRLVSGCPPHVAAMVRFALATGLREANITGLEWSQVDLTRRVAWIHPDQAKAGKAIGVPLNRDAIVVLREQEGRHPVRVFTYEGRPVAKANASAFAKAVRRAELHEVCWHTLRHTWASWHVQAGTPLHVLQELGGWASFEMVRRYAHLAPEHLAEHADRIAGPRSAQLTDHADRDVKKAC